MESFTRSSSHVMSPSSDHIVFSRYPLQDMLKCYTTSLLLVQYLIISTCIFLLMIHFHHCSQHIPSANIARLINRSLKIEKNQIFSQIQQHNNPNLIHTPTQWKLSNNPHFFSQTFCTVLDMKTCERFPTRLLNTFYSQNGVIYTGLCF